MKILGIIPARYGSTRFPGKPLAMIHGKTMVQRVYEQAMRSSSLSHVVVATDDERIAGNVKDFGGNVVMTSPAHPSGTDRCLEALQQMEVGYDAVINIQGDEPFIDPSQIDAVCNLITKPEVQIATLVKKITEAETLLDVNKVKVVMSTGGLALYFSRQVIPWVKDTPVEKWLLQRTYYKHIGLYAYKCEVLAAICRLPPSPLEKCESLEQLRWLENDYRIHVAITEIETPAIDTPSDLTRVLDSLS